MLITIMSEAWQNCLQLHSPLRQTTDPILCTCLHFEMNVSCKFPHSPWLCVWCAMAPQSRRRIAVIGHPLLLQNTKLLLFSQSSTSNSSSWTLQWLVEVFGNFLCAPTYTLSTARLLFFIVMRNVFTKALLMCFL